MADPHKYQFDLPTTGTPSNVTIPQQWFPGVQNYWSQCTTKRTVSNHITGVVAVVIHATAGVSSVGAVSVMHPPPGEDAASFHWLVPDEDEPQHGNTIWACVREEDAAWHVRNSKSHPDVNGGQTRVNHWSLGIEIVNRQSGGDAFSDWQVAITAQIVRYCWAKYPNLRHIVSHAKLDPDRRDDPGSNFPWERFKSLVLNTGSEPLASLDIHSIDAASEERFAKWENATLEQEDANDELGEKNASKVHDAKQDGPPNT